MGEQKNLLLAIVLSIAIIVIFQLLFPQQTITTSNKSEINEKTNYILMFFENFEDQLLDQNFPSIIEINFIKDA